MKRIMEMSNEELLRAIDLCNETGTNLTSHGQADDYLVGSMKMAKVYQSELERRLLLNKKTGEIPGEKGEQLE